MLWNVRLFTGGVRACLIALLRSFCRLRAGLRLTVFAEINALLSARRRS